MDKTTAEEMVYAFGAAVRILAASEARNCARASQRIEVNTTETAIIAALTTPEPAPRPPVVTDPKPQGEEASHCTCHCKCIDPLTAGFVKVCKECFNGDHLAGYLGKREAARVPPEATQCQCIISKGYQGETICRECGLPSHEGLRLNQATPSKPAEPLHDIEVDEKVIDASWTAGYLNGVNASKISTDQLLEAAKAVLNWYDRTVCTVGEPKQIKSMREAIEAREAGQCP